MMRSSIEREPQPQHDEQESNKASSTSGSSSSSSGYGSLRRNRDSLHLDLENFDSEDVPEDCPYVLTSPRSLEACKRLRVKPIDLLPCSLDEVRQHLEAEGDLSFEALSVLREAEDERRTTLENCRRLRRTLIDEQQLDEANKNEQNNASDSQQQQLAVANESDSDTLLLAYSTGEENSGSRRVSASSLESSASSSDFCDRPEADQDLGAGGSQALKKSTVCLNLSMIDWAEVDESELVLSSARGRASVTFSDTPVLQQWAPSAKTRPRSSRSSASVFRNPYGPPLYQHSRPAAKAAEQLATGVTPLTASAPGSRPTTPRVGRRKQQHQACSSRHFSSPVTGVVDDEQEDAAPEADRDTPVSAFRGRKKKGSKKVTRPLSQQYQQHRDCSDEPRNASPVRRAQRQRSASTHRNMKKLSDCTKRLIRQIEGTREPQQQQQQPTSSGYSPEDTVNLILNHGQASDLTSHDRRTLLLFAQKQHRARSAEQRAHEQHLQWRREAQHLKEEKRRKEAALQQFLAEKRRREAETNEQKLEEARERFHQSQSILRRLLKEKEERSRSCLNEAQRRKDASFSRWRASEEARRVAVEEALEELLARDTQYRKELNAHLEKRLNVAERRRRSREDRYKESKAAEHECEFERVSSRRMLLQRENREQIKQIREAIRAKAERIHRFRDSGNNIKEKQALANRLERETRSRKARALKQELDTKLDAWRTQVLEVQSASITKAEEKAKGELKKKRWRVASESRRREQRHAEGLHQVEGDWRAWQHESRKQIRVKQDKSDRFVKDKEDAKRKSREHAFKMVELRDAVRARFRPDTFDQRVSRMEFEMRTTTRRIE